METTITQDPQDTKQDTNQEAPKKRGPGRPRTRPVRTAKYHIYHEKNDGSLVHLGEQTARNAETAATDFLRENEDMIDQQPFFIVPNRNISRIKAQVTTTTKVKVTSEE